MKIVLITGSAGLIGSEAVGFFCDRGFIAVGLDNNMRKTFFGEEASTEWNRDRLLMNYAGRYIHHDVDIRHDDGVRRVFEEYGTDIDLVIHTAAQPSHDWAARDPYTDFTRQRQSAPLNLLEATRQFCPQAPFIFTSTNKVYGDRPNHLPLVETGDAVGNRAETIRIATGHRRDACRSTTASTSLVRCVKGRRGHVGAGVRPLFRHEDSLFPRRLFDRAQPFRHAAPRLSRLSHEVHDDGRRPIRFLATRASRCATISTAHDLVNAF